jgi:tetratricopeptide (TPR) repeat protein
MTNVEALQLLELTPPFTMAELKKAYWQAQMVWHPDRFPANGELQVKALARSKLINEAFSEISRALRAGYDFKVTAPRQATTYRKAASQEPPKNAADFNRRGVGYQSKGRTNKAIADFTEAIRLDPKVGVYHRNRGVAYANKRRLPDAIADFTEAVRLDPNINLAPTNAYSYRARAAVYEQEHAYSSAIADFSEAIRLDPEVAEVHFRRGIAYKNTGEYANAIVDFNEARRLAPRKHFCFRADFRRHAKLCEDRGEYDQAIADYTEVIQSFSHTRSDYWSEFIYDCFCRARVYRKKGESDSAIADYGKAIEVAQWAYLGGSSAAAPYYKCRAQAYYDKGDFIHAQADLIEAMRLDPTGSGFIYQGDRFGGPDPRDEGWRHKCALTTLAGLYAQTGDFDHAVQYQKAFLRMPDLAPEEATDGLRRLACYELAGREGTRESQPSVRGDETPAPQPWRSARPA